MSIEVVSYAPTSPDTTDPVWLSHLGQTTGWRHTKNFPGGHTQAGFQFTGSPTLKHRALQAGRRIVAYAGAAAIFRGRLEQPVPGSPWQCTVTGAAALGKDFQAHGATNIYSANDMIDQAIDDGLPWTRTASFNNPAGTAAEYSATVDDVLAVSVTQGGYWTLDDESDVKHRNAPPPVGLALYATNIPPRTLAGYATAVVIAYNVGTAGDPYHVVRVAYGPKDLYGRIDLPVDMTNSGNTSSLEMGDVANALLAKFAMLGLPWAGQFVARPGQLSSLASGAPIGELANVSAYNTVRIVEVNTEQPVAGVVDVPIGQVDYDDAAQTLTLTPLAASTDTFLATLVKAVRR